MSRRLFALGIMSVAIQGGAATLTRGPYLQLGTSQGIVVRWRTDVATDSRVRYGRSLAALGMTADDPTVTTEHVVPLLGLSSDAAYFYTVGSASETLAGPDKDHRFITTPSPGSVKPFRAWVIGDSGTADANARAVRDAFLALEGTFPTNLWLMLGDNAYTLGTDAEYQAAVFDMYPAVLEKTALWPTFGNHEAYSSNSVNQTGPYFDMFTLPKAGEAGGLASGTEAYYAFDFANVHFICLDSQGNSSLPGSAMLTWLENDLVSTNQEWVIAFWHHPPYSKGSHDSDWDPYLIAMRMNVLPVLEQGGVDLVLCGHSHSYERSMLIDSHYGFSWTFDPSDIKDAGDGRMDGNGAYRKPTAGLAPHEGTVYNVAGSSGKTSGGSLDYPAMYTSMNVLGSVILDVNGGRLDARFLDDSGAVRDHWTLVKGQRPNAEILSGAGASSSNAPVVKTWSHASPPGLVSSWSAYGAGNWGVNVGAVDARGGGVTEVVTGPGPGGNYGPQVRAFTPTGTGIAKVNFYAYGTLRHGVQPGGGDIDGDSHGEILTAPGPGAVFGPHVRAFNYDNAALAPVGAVSFFAYSTLRYGARVAGWSVDVDSYAEILTGAGAGAVFGPHVRIFGFDNASVAAGASFFAFPYGQYGAAVAAGNTDADLPGEVVAAHGPDPGSGAVDVKGFDVSGAATNAWTVTPFTGVGGTEVALGDLDFDGRDELVAGQGWGAANPSRIRGFDIVGSGGAAIPGVDFIAYPGQSYGAKVAAGDTGTP